MAVHEASPGRWITLNFSFGVTCVTSSDYRRLARALRLDKEKRGTSDTGLSTESRGLENTLDWPCSGRPRAEVDPGEASTGPPALWDEAARF